MKIFCVGRNYTEHIEELGNNRPDTPVIFMKPDTALLKNNAPFYLPDFSKDIHYEVEILIKIKKEGKSIPVEFAPKYYDQVGLGIDFTARDIQKKLKEKGLPWELSKGFNGAAVVSDFISKEHFDLENLNFTLQKNEETVQQGNTQLMLWNINEIIAYISKYFLLKAGDIIFTGTPKGVGQTIIGDKLTGFIENQKMFDFNVK